MNRRQMLEATAALIATTGLPGVPACECEEQPPVISGVCLFRLADGSEHRVLGTMKHLDSATQFSAEVPENAELIGIEFTSDCGGALFNAVFAATKIDAGLANG